MYGKEALMAQFTSEEFEKIKGNVEALKRIGEALDTYFENLICQWVDAHPNDDIAISEFESVVAGILAVVTGHRLGLLMHVRERSGLSGCKAHPFDLFMRILTSQSPEAYEGSPLGEEIAKLTRGNEPANEFWAKSEDIIN